MSGRTLIRKRRLYKQNYRGDLVSADYGIYIVLFSLAGMSAAWGLDALSTEHAHLYGMPVGAMGILGLIDDLFGSREVGGFGGHFGRLLTERRLTTGALKAIGGGITAIAAGWGISGGNVIEWVLAAGLIAFSANTLNLLDMRPGRAGAAFFMGMLIAAALSGFRIKAPLAAASICIPAAIGYIWDRNGRAMMGDAGSNALGAALGVTFALSAPTWAQAAFLVLLVVLNVYSERRSITDAIERHPLLKKIDSWTGVR